MKNFKKFLAVALVLAQVLCLTAVLAIGVNAEMKTDGSQRSYTFYKADNATMLEDNWVKDDAWANIPKSEGFNYYYGDAISDTAFAAHFKAMWATVESNNYLYFRVEVADIAPGKCTVSGETWRQDGFVFAVSEDGTNKKIQTKTQATSDSTTSVKTVDSDVDYTVTRTSGTGLVINLRYKITSTDVVTNGKIFFDFQVQNAEGGESTKYQQRAWNSIKGKTYTTSAPSYYGTGYLSNINAKDAIAVKYNGNTIALVDSIEDAPVVWKIKDEKLTISADNIVTAASYTDKYLVKTASDANSVTYATLDLGFEMQEGASVRLSNPTGLRFETHINKAAYDALVATGAKVTVGTVIVPTDYLTSTAFTMEALTAAGKDYLNIVNNGWNSNSTATVYSFYGSIVDVKEGNYTRDFSAVAYITIGEGADAITIYSAYDADVHSRNIAAVAQAALAANDPALTSNDKAILNGFAGNNA